nr:capZ-interacting protein isoform X3 [Meriones unguiculatus]
MEERPAAETNSNVDSSAQPSVAQLAGRFREQAVVARDPTPASKPTRRKPPCSLPLFPPKVELGQNGEQKSPSSASHPPKIKVKSSPLIEKLQVRTRGSIKRRPPSRRFRRSQSDCGDLRDYRAVEASQENGARDENGDDVFPSKSKAPGSPTPNQEAMGDGVERTLGAAEKPLRRSMRNSTEKPEEQIGTPEEANAGEKAGQNPDTASQGSPEVPESPQTCSPQSENGCGSPLEESAPGEHTDTGKATAGTASEERVADEEDRLGQRSPDANTLEEGAEIREKAPPSSSGRIEGIIGADPETKQKEGAPQELSCSPGAHQAPAETSNEIQNDHGVPKDGMPMEDTRM